MIASWRLGSATGLGAQAMRGGSMRMTPREGYTAGPATARATTWPRRSSRLAGGVEQIIDATPLRGRENILRNIDAQIMRRGVENDSKFPANARPDDSGLRKFQPDSELIRRRAGGEAFRSLAADYGVCHTTLSRYFRRAAVAKQLRGQRRAQGRYRRPQRTGDHS
jgi:hypothetical protein